MIHAAPSGPWITPCGAEPRPSATSSHAAAGRVEPAEVAAALRGEPDAAVGRRRDVVDAGRLRRGERPRLHARGRRRRREPGRRAARRHREQRAERVSSRHRLHGHLLRAAASPPLCFACTARRTPCGGARRPRRSRVTRSVHRPGAHGVPETGGPAGARRHPSPARPPGPAGRPRPAGGGASARPPSGPAQRPLPGASRRRSAIQCCRGADACSSLNRDRDAAGRTECNAARPSCAGRARPAARLPRDAPPGAGATRDPAVTALPGARRPSSSAWRRRSGARHVARGQYGSRRRRSPQRAERCCARSRRLLRPVRGRAARPVAPVAGATARRAAPPPCPGRNRGAAPHELRSHIRQPAGLRPPAPSPARVAGGVTAPARSGWCRRHEVAPAFEGGRSAARVRICQLDVNWSIFRPRGLARATRVLVDVQAGWPKQARACPALPSCRRCHWRVCTCAASRRGGRVDARGRPSGLARHRARQYIGRPRHAKHARAPSAAGPAISPTIRCPSSPQPTRWLEGSEAVRRRTGVSTPSPRAAHVRAACGPCRA